MGISLGANVTIAQYLGARRGDKVERTVQTAILMSFGLGVLLAIIGELIVYPAFWVLEVPPDVYDMAEQYLRIFLLGLPFLSLYNFEAAIFRSCGDGRTPLYSLIAANLVNIVFDLLSVLVFDFGLAVSSGRRSLPLPSTRLSSWPCCAGRRTASAWNATTCAFPGKNCTISSILACPPVSRAWSLPCPTSSSSRPSTAWGQKPWRVGCGFHHRRQYLLLRQRFQPGHDDLRRPELRRPQLAPLFPHYESRLRR